MDYDHLFVVDTLPIVRQISRAETEPFILGIHYAKRFPSISLAYGLFIDGQLEGICTFGTPSSSTLRRGVCGPSYEKYVLELNRLCLRNNVKGHASMLVGRSLRLIQKDAIVVSFADTEQGHVGTVYQATNFTYCGLSAKRTDWKVRGMEHLHGQTVSDEFRGMPNRAARMREKYGDAFYLSPRSRKHRYVTFLGSRAFKRDAMKALRYNIEAYPKKPVD